MSLQKPNLSIFTNNLRSKQNKKNTAHPFVDIDEQEMYLPIFAKFQQKVLNWRVVGAR